MTLSKLRNGVTAAEFAALCGVSVFTVNSWDCGRLKPSAARVAAIARRLKTPALIEETIREMVLSYESRLRDKCNAAK